jgi:hypothetical protein
MATVVSAGTSAEHRERLFFLIMAGAIAVTVIVAFGLFYQAGVSSFASPWWVHLHGVTSMTWIGFYVLQNTLVFKNHIALHRKLGRIGAAYAVWMVLVGLVLTPLTLAVGRSPPFFTPAYFLALDWVNIVIFGALLYAAIRNRKRTDWHQRLPHRSMLPCCWPTLSLPCSSTGVTAGAPTPPTLGESQRWS